MPIVKVSPNTEVSDLTHDISLSHDSTSIGLIFAQGASILQHVPKTEPVRQFSETQNDWTGGRGRKFFREDPTAFWDAKDAWTMTGGKLFNAPEWFFSNGIVSQDMVYSGSVGWLTLYGSNRYQGTKFTASASYSASTALLKIRQVGYPDALRVSIYSDNSGTPDSSLKTKAVNPVSGDFEAKDYVFTFATTLSLTSSTNYWVVINGGANDNSSNHWEVGVDTTGARVSKSSADASVWASSSNDLYYKISPASVNEITYFFNHSDALYCIVVKDSGASPNLYINGDRGIATGGTTATLVDTNAGCATWTANEWAGAWVRIISGAGKGQAREIESNTTTALTVTPVFDIAPNSTSNYVIYSSDKWTELTGHGLTKCTCRPISVNRVAYFCQGTVTNMRRMRVDTTKTNNHDFDDTSSDFRYDFAENHMLPNVGLRVWLAKKSGVMAYTSAPAWAGTTTITPIRGGVSGSDDTEITSLKSGGEKLYIGKEDGLWWVDETVPKQFTLSVKDVPEPTNLIGITTQGDTVYFGYGNSWGYMTSGQHKDLLNYRSGYEGLPENRSGVVSASITVLGWVFFAVDGGEDNYSSIYAWNGIGLHEVWRSWTTNIRIRDMFYQPCFNTRGRLWFNSDNNPVYIEFPLKRSNPFLDSGMTYRSDFSFTTGTIDVQKENLYKMFAEIRLMSQNLAVNTQWVEADYQINEDVESTTWTRLGRFSQSPYQVMPFAKGEVQKIRFRFRAHTDTSTTPVVITSFDIPGEVSEPPKYQWVGTFKTDENQETYTGQPDFKPDYLIDWITEAHNKEIVCTMRAARKPDDDKKVTVSLPADVSDWVEKGKWGGRISFQIREV